MSERYPSDPEMLLTYLENARKKRRFFSWVAALSMVVAVLALLLAFSVVITQHNNLITGCERSHVRDREMARRAFTDGALEDRASALARARADCAAQYSLLP